MERCGRAGWCGPKPRAVGVSPAQAASLRAEPNLAAESAAAPAEPGAAAAPADGAPRAARSTPRAASQRAAAAPRSRRRSWHSSAAPRRSPSTAAGATGAGRSRSPPAAPPAEHGLEHRGRARRQAADHAQHRFQPIRHIPVWQDLPRPIDHRHLGPLAVHIDSHVSDIAGLLSQLACHPEHRSTGLSRKGSGLTPGPHGVGSVLSQRCKCLVSTCRIGLD